MSTSSRSFGSMASYTSQHSSQGLTQTPRASYPSENTSVDSAHGSDCQVLDECLFENPQASQHTFLTYASTITEDMEREEPVDDEILPLERPPVFANPDLIAASPKDFAELFPSSRKMLIRHDDQTIDGNMNLRIDTPVKTTDGRHKEMTLFHLRMHDLRRRDFSLRRYCRDSGREVCHSMRKPQVCVTKRPKTSKPFMRTLRSSPLSSKSNSENLKRHDSGYSSLDGDNNTLSRKSSVTRSEEATSSFTTALSNDICLEFSNYARFKLNFNEIKDDTRYTFEYYGLLYAWERDVETTVNGIETRYILHRLCDRMIVAHIDPIPLSADDARMEVEKGGWVSPCVMYMSDRSVSHGPADVADVVVVTGIMALVDDTIRRRFEAQPVLQSQSRHQTSRSQTQPKDYLKSKIRAADPRRGLAVYASKLSCI